jgi:hypothetical protein
MSGSLGFGGMEGADMRGRVGRWSIGLALLATGGVALPSAMAGGPAPWYDRTGIRVGYVGSVAGGPSQGRAATAATGGALAVVGDDVYFAGVSDLLQGVPDYVGVLHRRSAQVRVAAGVGDCPLSGGQRRPTNVVATSAMLCIGDVAADAHRRVVYVADGGSGEVLALAHGRLNQVTGLPDSGGITDMAVGPDGSLYVIDGARILRRTPSGSVTVVAGGGSPDTPNEGDGLPAIGAPIFPSQLTVDAHGDVLFTERTTGRVREVNRLGIISTVAGGNPTACGDGGLAALATLSSPTSIAVGVAGNIYVTEDNRIRRIDRLGQISTYYGQPCAGQVATVPAAGVLPGLLAADPHGGLLMSSAAALYRFQGSHLTQLTGTDVRGGYGNGGYAADAPITPVGALALDGAGGLFLTQADIVRWISPAGILQTVRPSAPLAVRALAPAPGHQVYGTDGGSIFRIAHTGTVTMIANIPGLLPSLGSDPEGNIYAAVFGADARTRIVTISPTGQTRTLAGGGASFEPSPDGTPAQGASLGMVTWITYWRGAVYFVDWVTNRLRTITPTGQLRTVVGDPHSSASDDYPKCRYGNESGPGTQTCMSYPIFSLTAGDDGVYFISGSAGRGTPYRVQANGYVTRIATGEDTYDSSEKIQPIGDALPYGARVIAAGPDGHLFIADKKRIRLARISNN